MRQLIYCHMPMALHTYISSASLYVSAPSLNCLIQDSHSEAEYSHRAAVQFMAYVTLNDAHVNEN